MKIGFDAKRAFQNFTGLGNYSRTLLAGMKAAYPQHEYHLYSPRLTELPRTAFLLKPNAFHLHSATGSRRAFWRSRGMLRDLQRDQLDVYHGLSHELPFGIHRTTISTVVTIHDLIFYHYPRQYGRWDRMIYDRKFRYACQVADKIVAISESTRQDILRFYQVPEQKVSVIYQGCESAFYEPVSGEEREQLRKRYRLPERYCLYVGSVIERKNLANILKALRELPDTQLVVMGGGSAYLNKMQSLVSQQKLDKQVHWRNMIPFADFPAVYQNATAMIYPSYYEGFGLPVLEALASGLPVITSNRSSLPEAGGPGSLYVDPDDVGELASTIRQVEGSESLRESMRAQGILHAERFRPEPLLRAYHEVYRSLQK